MVGSCHAERIEGDSAWWLSIWIRERRVASHFPTEWTSLQMQVITRDTYTLPLAIQHQVH